MAAGVRVLLHLVPLQSFATDALIDVVSSEREKQFSPRISHGWNSRLCLEGRYTFNSDSQELVTSSVLLFRNAAVEFAYVYEPYLGDKVVPAFYYEKEVVEALRNCFATLNAIGVAPPAFIILTLMDLDGATFIVDGNLSRTRRKSDRDVMVIPEAYVETWEQDPAAVLRPVFDIVWNAFGLARSTSYDQSGRWLNLS